MPLGMGSTGTQRNRKLNEFFIWRRKKNFQNVFQSSQERFRGSSLFRKMQLFQVKKLTLVCSQLPLTKGSLPSEPKLSSKNSPTGSNEDTNSLTDLFTNMAHTGTSPCRTWDSQQDDSETNLELHNKLQEDKEYNQWIYTHFGGGLQVVHEPGSAGP